jgi:hypothetical protein
MFPEDSADHISLQALWKYRADKNLLNFDQMHHLYRCDECLSLLGICQTCERIEEAERVRAGRPKRPG